MLRNQNPMGSACSGIQTKIPLWGGQHPPECQSNQAPEGTFSSKIIPELGGQYAPEYPPEKITGRMGQYALKQVGQFGLKRLGQYQLKQVGQFTPKWGGQYGVRLSLGVKIKRDSSLNLTSKTVLFPKKLALANKVVANLKWKVD